MSAILPLPNPAPHRGGLASVLSPLIGRDGEPLPEQEWARGVIWTNNGVGESFVAGFGGGSFGIYADGDEKPENDNPDSNEFEPVALGAMFGCQMNAPGGVLGDVSQARAVSLLERTTFSDLARLLHTGETYPCGAPDGSLPNPGFQSVAQLPAGSDGTVPGSIRGTLQGLLDGVCGAPNGDPGWHSEPVFHIPLAWMPHFIGDLVRWSDEEQKFKFGLYDVSFDCYPNEPPAAGGTVEPDGSEVWIYASLRPQAAVSDVQGLGARRELENRYTYRAERQAIVAFDTTLVMAAKALVG